jgi:hypothetical protein
MKTPTQHPLADLTKPHVHILFTRKNGTTHHFYSCINEMTGSRLSAFDSDPPRIDDGMAWVQRMIRNIQANEKVLSFNASKHFQP